jgi:mono/diheme cytochrome c family protein
MRTGSGNLLVLEAAALVLTLIANAPGEAQTTGPKVPPLVISSMQGRDLFEFYCATCHGRDGKGAGPAVPALKAPPPDLTTLAVRNGGAFPAARVTAVVTNDTARQTPAHGSNEMPVWGPIFKGLDQNDSMNRLRIENIVRYIEGMQAK